MHLTIITPVFNEERIIEAKIKNTLLLNYPKELLRVIFADGGSTDATRTIITHYAKKHPHLSLVETRAKGKIPQINEVISNVTSDIIIITDADGILASNVLAEFVNTFNQSPAIGAVGAYVSPGISMPEEHAYWQLQNRLRVLESAFYAPSIMIGVCYAFRKGIITHYPVDVIADDIYTTFETIRQGYRVVYCSSAQVTEIRAPKTLREMLTHKSRKANAYLKELFRFLTLFKTTPWRWKLIFYTKLAQFTIVPITFFSLLISGIGWILFTHSIPEYIILVNTTMLLFVIFDLFDKTKIVTTIILSQAIVVLTLVRFPFYHQTSRYKKIR